MVEDASSGTPGTAPPAPPRIGLWGTFDLQSYGQALYLRILERELAARLPGAEIRAFAPLGDVANRFSESEPPEPLGPWTSERVATLAEELDFVMVVGPEVHPRDELLGPQYGVEPAEMRERAPSRSFIDGLGPELEGECPVAWLAVRVPFDIDPRDAPRFRQALAGRPSVAVRDEGSRRRLEEAGVDRDVEVVPDPGFLLPRVVSTRPLEKRLAHLRTMGWYPESERPLVVQGDRGSLSRVPGMAAALERLRDERPGLEFVLLETGPGDGEFAAAMADALPGARAVPTSGLGDVAAAISASAGFVGTSFHGAITALVTGRPHVGLSWGGGTVLEGLAAMTGGSVTLVERPEDVPAALEKAEALVQTSDIVAALQERVDAHLDRLAGIIREVAARRGRAAPAPRSGAEEQVTTLRRAHHARGRQLVLLRWALSERVDELAAQVAAERGRARHLEGELALRTRELEGLLNTKTFRYTAPLRRLYGTLRGWRRRG